MINVSTKAIIYLLTYINQKNSNLCFHNFDLISVFLLESTYETTSIIKQCRNKKIRKKVHIYTHSYKQSKNNILHFLFRKLCISLKYAVFNQFQQPIHNAIVCTQLTFDFLVWFVCFVLFFFPFFLFFAFSFHAIWR